MDYHLGHARFMNKQVILASGSEARKNILEAAGLSFARMPSGVNEGKIKIEAKKAGKSAQETALILAQQKALSLDEKGGSYIIGADQILSMGETWYDKTKTMADVMSQLQSLRKNVFCLSSAVCVVKDKKVIWDHVTVTRAQLRDFSDAFLAEYIKRNNKTLLGICGGCPLEGEGIQLIEWLDGDYHSFLGLPLLPLLSFLREEGVLLS